MDEIYGLTSFNGPDISDSVPFTLILQLDAESPGYHPSKLHMVWSTINKTFGFSGVRAASIVLDLT